MKKVVKFFKVTGILVIGLLCFHINIATGKKTNPEQPETVTVLTDSAKSILFVGNSLTYYNDLPGFVVKIAKVNGIEVKTDMLAYANYALEDHWNDGRLQQLIATKKYDFVVVQQGPSSQPDGGEMLLKEGAKIKALCTKYDTQLAFFMVWPAFVNFSNFDGVIKNYTDAATVTNSLLCPVGKVWKEHFLATNDYSYYGHDMFHPSPKGTESAALIVFRTLLQ